MRLEMTQKLVRRLESLAPATPLLLVEPVWSALPFSLLLLWQEHGMIQMQGENHVVRVVCSTIANCCS